MSRARIVTVAVVVTAAAAAFVALRPKSPPAGTPGAGPGPSGPAAAVSEPVSFAIASPADDHVGIEPCCRIPGGGLYSLAAFYDRAAEHLTPLVRIHLGDMTQIPGEPGGLLASFRNQQILPSTQARVIALGPGELAVGSDFIRTSFNAPDPAVVCANATDATGSPLLPSWTMVDADKRTVVLVGAVAPSLQPALAAADSDIRLAPDGPAVAGALAQGLAEAEKRGRKVHARVLLHHGTPDETAELVRAVPGFTFAVAARGGDTPEMEPRRVGDTLVFASGRRGRFGWTVTVDQGVPLGWRLERIGISLMAAGSPTPGAAQAEVEVVRDLIFARVRGGDDFRTPDPRGTYVGSARCAPCHSEQCAEHDASAHASLPRNFGERGLGGASCLLCHVTGAFRKSGWQAKDAPADLGAVSCEACHGPGSEHVEKPAAGYGIFELSRCRTCHTPDRAPTFDAEVLWKKWGHGVR